ncbi:MAG: WecB/TagA/CpsF family glycosyltransferase, partial [Phycisphaeraceae bacterium]|nr:WecB/TagA/CpsF family glycosyltransferase [Phycisphaeraceae bacterium]
GDPGTAETAAERLTERFPGLKVAGTACPPPGFEDDPEALEYLLTDLRTADPDIVYVALGFPKQERLIARFRKDLPGTWWIGVGISFSYLAGTVRRAPGWARRLGVEWVFRLFQEPGRLWRRYLLHGIPFGFRLLGHAVARRLDSPQSSHDTKPPSSQES